MDPLQHEYLTRSESAAFIRGSMTYLDTLARQGVLRPIKLHIGNRTQGRVLYRRCDLEAFLNAHQVPEKSA